MPMPSPVFWRGRSQPNLEARFERRMAPLTRRRHGDRRLRAASSLCLEAARHRGRVLANARPLPFCECKAAVGAYLHRATHPA